MLFMGERDMQHHVLDYARYVESRHLRPLQVALIRLLCDPRRYQN